MANENPGPPGPQQQPPVVRKAHNAISKEARAMLMTKNQAKAQNMCDDIDAVWDQVDKAAVDIGDKYNRSVLSVQQAIGSGALLSGRTHIKINSWCAYLHGIMEEWHNEGQDTGLSYSLIPISYALISGL